MKKSKRAQSGFSMMEVFISMWLGLVIFGFVYMAVGVLHRTNHKTHAAGVQTVKH